LKKLSNSSSVIGFGKDFSHLLVFTISSTNLSNTFITSDSGLYSNNVIDLYSAHAIISLLGTKAIISSPILSTNASITFLSKVLLLALTIIHHIYIQLLEY
jgi:hypothetical protein